MKNPKLTLRAARMNLGLTRKEAAKLFEIHHMTLAHYEADSLEIPLSFYNQIPKIYGVPIENIHFGKESDHYAELRSQFKITC